MYSKFTKPKSVFTGVVAGCCAAIVSCASAQEPDSRPSVPGVPAVGVRSEQPRPSAPASGLLTDRPEDEKAIRSMADAFARSFSSGDAKAIAGMFTEDAEFVDENGERVRGRRAIEQLYTRIFEGRPHSTIEIEIQSLRFLSPDVAREEGRTTVKSASETDSIRQYTLFHVKEGGHWLCSSVREEVCDNVAHHEHLKPLEWLTGEWIDQSSGSTVHVTCRWSPEKNFLLRDFTVHVQGRPVMTVNERIGWDPLTKQIRSWAFDSQGGYADGLWSRRGKEWVIKSRGVLPDGRCATATHVLASTGTNSARWSSTERTVGDQNIDEQADYVMVRRAAAPQVSRAR